MDDDLDQFSQAFVAITPSKANFFSKIDRDGQMHFFSVRFGLKPAEKQAASKPGASLSLSVAPSQEAIRKQSTFSLLANFSGSAEGSEASSSSLVVTVTWTDVLREYYEAELDYESLSSLKSSHHPDLVWGSWFDLFIEATHNTSRVHTSFSTAESRSKDVMQMSLTAPASAAAATFSFELFVVRDTQKQKRKMQEILMVCAALGECSAAREAELLQRQSELENEVQRYQERLKIAEDKLSVFRPPNGSREAGRSGERGEGLKMASSSQTIGVKRKEAPKSLINPTSKRRQAKGAKLPD